MAVSLRVLRLPFPQSVPVTWYCGALMGTFTCFPPFLTRKHTCRASWTSTGCSATANQIFWKALPTSGSSTSSAILTVLVEAGFPALCMFRPPVIFFFLHSFHTGSVIFMCSWRTQCVDLPVVGSFLFHFHLCACPRRNGADRCNRAMVFPFIPFVHPSSFFRCRDDTQVGRGSPALSQPEFPSRRGFHRWPSLD